MSLRKINLKRVLCALLASAMVVMPVTPASAATARATTMKLEKTEGTVMLKTQNGSARKLTNGMRLYNGNKLETAKYSYAYVSLDSTKAVKLDQSSSATLRQNGKELELLVKSGKLFFNVSKPLTQKENMNVRTSTMVTGIRGTCGVVEYVNVNKSRLYLLEGKVTLGSGENATTIYGGQTATVVLQPKMESGGTDQPGESDKPGDADKPDKEVEQKVLVEKMTEKTIPPVALQEIVSDPVLQQKIEKSTELKIEKIKEAFEQFQKEEAERIEAEKEEQEKDNDKETAEQTTENTTSSGGGSYTPSTPVVTDATLTGSVSAAAINTALATYNKVTVSAGTTDADGTTVNTAVTLETNVTIPAGKTLTIECAVASANGSKIAVGDGTLIDTQGDASKVIAGGDTLLCTCTASNASSSSSVYAKEFNTQVADYINIFAQAPAFGTVIFSRNGVVTSNITLQPASASQQKIQLEMGRFTLEIKSGTLTLASDVSIASNSSDATVLLSGGNLIMQGMSTYSDIVIQNTGSGTSIKRTAGTITWNNTGLGVAAGSVEKTIEGASAPGDQTRATLPEWVNVKAGYVPVWWGGQITLQKVPAEFTSDTVSVAQVNLSLSINQEVTIGESTRVFFASSDTVTVPAGKTLNVRSQVTGSDADGYSGGFNMVSNSTLSVEDGANLNVNGWIQGRGTISVGSKANVVVGSAGKIEATSIQLDKAQLTNNNIIDGTNITSTGGSTIINNALIKLAGAYGYGTSVSEVLGDTYIGGSDSLLLSDVESGAMAPEDTLMFATVADGGTVKQCYYASRMNDLVIHYMNVLTEDGKDTTIKWVFKNNVLVPEGKEIALTNFNADTGTYALQVAGNLTP